MAGELTHSRVVVREASPEDAAAVVRLIRELAAADGETTPITETYAMGFLDAPGNGVLLAEIGDEAVGLISYSVRPNLYHAGYSASIDELVVSSGYRDRGVGGVLIDHLLHHLKALGCVEVSVTTMPGNEGAQRFYRAHGLVDEALFLEKHF
ncbi:MAG TPA: GNAT family N-acetyltransferase [Anaerolineae bacterium]|nr:GNAT family N-acetyltransferase [Anaerolineae bacterium]